TRSSRSCRPRLSEPPRGRAGPPALAAPAPQAPAACHDYLFFRTAGRPTLTEISAGAAVPVRAPVPARHAGAGRFSPRGEGRRGFFRPPTAQALAFCPAGGQTGRFTQAERGIA